MTQEATRRMTQPIDPKQAASANPAVDVRKLEEAAEVRQRMERAGIVPSASYRLSPALGNERMSPTKGFVARMHRAR